MKTVKAKIEKGFFIQLIDRLSWFDRAFIMEWSKRCLILETLNHFLFYDKTFPLNSVLKIYFTQLST